MARSPSIIMSAAETKAALKTITAQIKAADKEHALFLKAQIALVKENEKNLKLINKNTDAAQKAHDKVLAPLLKQQAQLTVE